MPSLTKKSILLSISGFIDVIIRVIAAVFVTRLITQALGEDLYGAWAMILQILGYLALVNLKTTTTLQTRLAAMNHSENIYPKQLVFSACRRLFSLTIGFTFLISIVVVFFSSRLFPENLNSIFEIKLVLIIGVFGLIVEQYGSLFGSALRGSNLDYRGIGIRSVTIIISNFFIILFLYLGMGIVGLAVSALLGNLIVALSWRFLALRILTWYKIVAVNADYFIEYFKQSLSTLIYSLGNMILVNSDAILIGIVLGNKFAGYYFISTSFIRSLVLPIISILLSSSGVGLSSLINSNNYARTINVTTEILQVSSVIIGFGGFFYILFNKSLIYYWVGLKYYSDERVELFFIIMVLVQFSNTLIQYLIDGLLLYKYKAIVSVFSAAFFILISVLFLKFFGLKGLILGSLLSNLFSITLYQRILQKHKKIFIDIKAMVLRWFYLISFFLIVDMFIKPMIQSFNLGELSFLALISAVLLGICAFKLLPSTFKNRILMNNPLKFNLEKK
jgi:O-antigen/teichoic acid export membrane protein